MTNTLGSSRARSASIRLLGWYPRPWRLRYLIEMRALLEQMPVGWRQVANLGFMGVREWCSPRALGWPARSAVNRVFVMRWLTFLVCGYAIDGIARVAAWKVREDGIAITDDMSMAATLLLLAVAVRTCVAGGLYLRHAKKHPKAREVQRPGFVRGWEVALWACMLFPFLVVRHAEPIPAYLSRSMVQIRPVVDVLQVFVWIQTALLVSGRTRRLIRVQGSWSRRNLGYRPTPPTLN